MASEKLYLEEHMVAPVLRDRLFRVDPAVLVSDFQPAGELDDADVAEIVEALCIMGFLNPVLIDAENVIVAGQGIVSAALQIGLDDIPALRLEDLNEEERRDYFYMTHDFFKFAEVDPEIFRIDAQGIMSFTASGRRALKVQAAAAALVAE